MNTSSNIQPEETITKGKISEKSSASGNLDACEKMTVQELKTKLRPYEKAWLPVNEGKASHTSVILTDELTKGPYPVDNSPRDIQKDSGGKTIECSYK
ncbi:hypothetical protein E3N88_10898 [Mikania micrantha]|uniref:Uncharacterized protein n=1 Tax=Mikania micrantha TaxID=192012 RepID=A0A5N6PE68_9ASTR|nr:hypothetical protein E3N88_10898 [Mikania micrantha]